MDNTLQRLINNTRQGFNSLAVEAIKVKDCYLLGLQLHHLPGGRCPPRSIAIQFNYFALVAAATEEKERVPDRRRDI